MSNYYIYEIKNLVNGKTYIGQRKCPEDKTPETDIDYMGSGLLIKKSIEKYGIENFKKNILVITETKENVNILEKVFIKLYREEGKAEYNISDGGAGGYCLGCLSNDEISEIYNRISSSNKGKHYHNKGKKFTEEHKRKISESNKGKTPTEETRLKISESNKGKRTGCENSFFGKHHSEESKLKISESNKGKHNVKFTEEHKRKISESNKGKSKGVKSTLETRLKLSKIRKGKIWFNNGMKEILSETCPEGFVKGRLSR